MILEVTPPPCRYWGVQLASEYGEALEWKVRQTSINGRQVHLDDDGRFQAVIAHTDPGVPNWLDASGHTVGLIALRYLQTDEVPEPSLRVVPLTDVLSHLGEGTPRVTEAERAETLRRRMLAAGRRPGC